jgi:hypothetical protein
MKRLHLTHANIIQLLEIESLPLDERKEIIASAVDLVEARALNRVTELLSESDQESLTKHLEEDDSDAVSELLSQNKINLVSIIEEEVEKVKEELLEVKKSV